MEGKGEGERGMGEGKGRIRCRHCYKRKTVKTRQSYPKISRISQRFFSFIYLFLSLKTRKGYTLMWHFRKTVLHKNNDEVV
jgi:hypothetical protein